MNFSLLDRSLLPGNQSSQLENLLSRLEGVRESSGGYVARCPAHADRSPSLSIKVVSDGRILFNCHAGCKGEQILERLQLTWKDLRGQASRVAHGPAVEKSHLYSEIQAWPWTEAVYDYQDVSGTSRFLVVRLRPRDRKKGFAQYRALADGRYQKGLDGIQTVLYRLPEVASAKASRARVYLVEGEKDVETLRKMGLVATCNPGGAGKWRSNFNAFLQGLRVVVLPDNDEVGKAHAESVASSLDGVAEEIRIVDLPDLPPKGDVSDWADRGGTREEFERLVELAPPWRPPRSSVCSRDFSQERFHLTDLGNAQRLVRLHGTDVRYCHPWQRWLIWDGRRWSSDQTGQIQRKAKDTVRAIYSEAAGIVEDRQRQLTAEHARRSESLARVKAMVVCAESEPGIPVLPKQLDEEQWLLNCLNGTLNLRTGQLHPHRREDLLTKMAPVAYDAAAECPVWEGFLARTLGSLDLVQFIQRAVGYSLTGETREHCLFFLYGTGRNGKSTFLECLYGLLGDYSQKADFSTFLEKKQDSIRNDLARLKGARFLSASEASEDRRFAEALIKDLTGGETITARHLYGEFFDFKPSFKLFLSANHKPSIRGMDEGIWSRIRLIPFTNYIPPEERDHRLAEKLQAEWPGILNWAVRGCLEWQRQGLGQPAEVERATRQYREEMDPLAGFLAGQCRLCPEASTTAKALYEAYTAWCSQNEEEPISQKAFGMRLADRGLRRYRGRSGGSVVWLWSGIGISSFFD